MNWNDAGPAAIVGAVVATVGVFAVELWIKPAFARRRIATVLLTELRLNARLLNAVQAHRSSDPESISESIVTSQRCWTAVEGDLHYLPEAALRTLLLTYSQLSEIDRLVAGYSQKGDLVLQLGDTPQARALFCEMQGNASLLTDSIARTLGQIERTVPHLERIVAEGPPELPPSA